MLKKSMKIVSVLLTIMVAFALTTSVFASTVTEWVPTPVDTSGATSSVQNMANAILSVTQTVGIAVAVIMLIVLAIKYISAAPSDKADIKKHAVVYVVGAVVLFAAAGIMQIIKQFALNIKPV